MASRTTRRRGGCEPGFKAPGGASPAKAKSVGETREEHWEAASFSSGNNLQSCGPARLELRVRRRWALLLGKRRVGAPTQASVVRTSDEPCRGFVPPVVARGLGGPVGGSRRLEPRGVFSVFGEGRRSLFLGPPGAPGRGRWAERRDTAVTGLGNESRGTAGDPRGGRRRGWPGTTQAPRSHHQARPRHDPGTTQAPPRHCPGTFQAAPRDQRGTTQPPGGTQAPPTPAGAPTGATRDPGSRPGGRPGGKKDPRRDYGDFAPRPFMHACLRGLPRHACHMG